MKQIWVKVMISSFPLKIGCIHFIGIGGIGMSGIAEILLQSGYLIQGSDLIEIKITKRLKDLGCKTEFMKVAGFLPQEKGVDNWS